MGTQRRGHWNHNIHFHRIVTEAVPPGATSALDVGTGEGALAGELRGTLPDVTGIDVDEDILATAATQHAGISWVYGDVMTYDFGRTFDVVASVATLHHLPSLPDALHRFADLTAPGGVVSIVGLARASTLHDHLWGAVGIAQHQWYSRTRDYREHTAPKVWPPPHTYAEVRNAAAEILPDAQWQQFPMWRYALTWNKPLETNRNARDGSLRGH